ncbi:MAG: tetratricopeptide repeat protein [Verrucomicrobia bacterium]|nr:tetratricopeptide repeat protein [Verrucomicrobiota bacterium]
MHQTQKYLLIGPIALFIAFGVAVYVKRQASRPRNPEAQLLFAKRLEMRLGADATATQAEWQSCLDAYERIFKVWPKSKEVPEAYASIGRVYKQRLKDPEQAFAWFTRVTEEFPDSEVAEGVRDERRALAYHYAESDATLPEFAAALSDYVNHNPEAFDLDKVLRDRGIAYLKLGLSDEAIADFERIIAEFPKGSWADDAVFYIGKAHNERGDDDKALEQFDRLIKDYPSSNQIGVARQRVSQIWERRLDARLDEFFRVRYGVERATMFFNPPRPLYDVDSKQDAERVDAALAQALDLDSAELSVEITGTTLTVTGSLVIRNPSAVEEADRAEDGGEDAAGDEKKSDDEQKAPTEAKTLWLLLNAGMAIESLTQGETALEFKRDRNLVEVTLAEPIAVDGQATLAFRVTNGGEDAPGIVIGENTGHAFAEAFWFPTLTLDDAFESRISIRRESEDAISNGANILARPQGLLVCTCAPPVQGRFLAYGSRQREQVSWGDRQLLFMHSEGTPSASVQAFLDEAVKAADYLLGVFGTYPYDKIVFAQSADVKDTVFEYGAGLILINDSVPLESIKPEQLCNVLVQQWYGALVRPISREMLWYTAGTASYYETLYLAHRYGNEAMAAHWAELRALYDELFAHLDQRAMAFRQREESTRIFDALVYTKGAWFLRALRWDIGADDGARGDAAFVEAQRAFFAKQSFKPVTFRDLRVEFDEAAGDEYETMFGAWLLGASAPSFTVEEWTSSPVSEGPMPDAVPPEGTSADETPGEEYDVLFKLAQATTPKFALAVEVAFEAGEQRVVRVARITKTTEGEGKDAKDVWYEAFTFALPFDPERIVLDPNEHLLFSPNAQRVWDRSQPDENPAVTP